eukprot:759513-Hanusia_phi.AAC.10
MGEPQEAPQQPQQQGQHRRRREVKKAKAWRDRTKGVAAYVCNVAADQNGCRTGQVVAIVLEHLIASSNSASLQLEEQVTAIKGKEAVGWWTEEEEEAREEEE